jgi:hypothetical protein
LSEVVSGKYPARQDASQIVTSITIGIGLEDMAVAPLKYAEAKNGKWVSCSSFELRITKIIVRNKGWRDNRRLLKKYPALAGS